MKCLVTGSSGFLGKIIADELAKDNTVIGLSRTSGEIKLDLATTIPSFNDHYNVVIHTAGKAHSPPKNQKQIEDFYRTNVIGTKNLLKGLENHKLPEKLVFISTVAVYGENKGDLITERSDLKAKDPYGRSKIQAEKTIIAWCNKYKITYTILRLPLVIGVNPPGNLKAMILGIKKGFYFNISGGTSRKSMVLAIDIAKYILKASEHGGIYNLTDGYHPSFLELSSAIALQLDKKTPKNIPYWLAKTLAIFGDMIGNNFPFNSMMLIKIMDDLTFDDSIARKTFGWDPNLVIENVKV